jgi:HPt (histidine-containing phosphotransfer) domain-containing protein
VDEPDPLDTERFDEIAGDFDRDELRELIDLFVRIGGQQLHDLDRALTRGDNEAAASAAHALKGGALGLGARAVADAAATIEVLGRADRDVTEPVRELHAAWPVTVTALRERVAE